MSDPWAFGWDAIAALAGVLAVVVASLLGWWGIRLAGRAVERSKQDYVATRADLVADSAADLRLLARAFDDQLNPFWAWRASSDADPKPDWMPVQRALNELEARFDNLLSAVRGLHAATGALGTSPSAATIERDLAASYAAHYIAYLYFSGAGGSTRDSLRGLYERELAIYPAEVGASVLLALDAVDVNTKVPNSVTTVNVSTVAKWAGLIDQLVLHAYTFAAIDR